MDKAGSDILTYLCESQESIAIHCKRDIAMIFTSVNIGIPRSVNDKFRPDAGNCGGKFSRIGNIEIMSPAYCVREKFLKIVPEHPICPENQYVVYLSNGFHHPLFCTYQSTVSFSASLKVDRGSHPILRSFVKSRE